MRVTVALVSASLQVYHYFCSWRLFYVLMCMLVCVYDITVFVCVRVCVRVRVCVFVRVSVYLFVCACVLCLAYVSQICFVNR